MEPNVLPKAKAEIPRKMKIKNINTKKLKEINVNVNVLEEIPNDSKLIFVFFS